MDILLDYADIEEAGLYKQCSDCEGYNEMEVAKLQLKKVVEWGDEDCKEHKGGGYQRWHCYQCREALKKEAGL